MKRFVSGALVFFIFGVINALPQSTDTEISPFFVTTTRNLSLGGTHIAHVDDIYALIVNPAALGRIAGAQKNVSAAGTSQSAFSKLKLLSRNTFGWQYTPQAAPQTDAETAMNEGVGFGGNVRPLALGYVEQGFGIGLFDHVYFDAQIKGGSFYTHSQADFMLNSGYSWTMISNKTHRLDVGITVKAFARGASTVMPGVDNSLFAFSTLVASFSALTVGGGFDLGVLYQLHDRFAAAFTVYDVFSPAAQIPLLQDNAGVTAPSFKTVAMGMNAGIAWNIVRRALLSWTVMADYKDVIGYAAQEPITTEKLVSGLSLGTELNLSNVFVFRLGVAGLKPAAGIGINLGALKVDTAIYALKQSGNEFDEGHFCMDLCVSVSN